MELKHLFPLFLLMDFIFQVQFSRERRVDEGRLLLVVELGPARTRLVFHTDHLVTDSQKYLLNM